MAGAAFLIRFLSAAFIYVSQVLLARWMGSAEFGIYVYLWTWVLLVGDLIHLGLASAAQRFIPAYTQQRAYDLLRGFLSGSRWLVLSIATAAALVFAGGVRLAQGWFAAADILPLYLACATLPAYALSNMLDGIARSYNWIGLALLPPYVLRPLLLLALMAAAHACGMPADTAAVMTAAALACWAAAIVQVVCLDRRLARAVPAGPKAYAVGSWLATALPILMVWGFYTLLTYTDVLVLRLFRPAEEVALYYAASKTLALVAFVYFSVGAAVAHRFSEYHAAGDRARLAAFVASSIRWTFWPSLAALFVVLTLGRPFLALFGPGFVDGYPLMFILAVGLLARSSVGPAERLLNMLGEQRACAAVYAVAFAVNLGLSLALAPRFGAAGAALATASAIVCESLILFLVVRRRLGLHVFVWRPREPAQPETAVHV
ncbi:MAG: lipopolysaccharide biosynthesis protein [Variibacter sp.]|nr:lipopolysaccharide biosynthesis protein [Variibacter sp.]